MTSSRHPSSSRGPTLTGGRASSRPVSSTPSLIASGLPLTPDDRHRDLLSSTEDEDDYHLPFEFDEAASSLQADSSVSSSKDSVSSAVRPAGPRPGGLESLHEEAAFVPPTTGSRQTRKRTSTEPRGSRARVDPTNEEKEGQAGSSLVEAALDGDTDAVRSALARGDRVRDKDLDGRDAILATILGSDKAR